MPDRVLEDDVLGRERRRGIKSLRRCHLPNFDIFIIQTTTNHLEHLKHLRFGDQDKLTEIENYIAVQIIISPRLVKDCWYLTLQKRERF